MFSSKPPFVMYTEVCIQLALLKDQLSVGAIYGYSIVSRKGLNVF